MLAVRSLFKLNTIIGRVCTNSIAKCNIESNHFRTTLHIIKYSTAVKDENTKKSVDNIYQGNLNKHIFRVKAFSLFSSAFGIICQPVLIPRAQELDSIPIACAMYSVLAFFTFVTPIFLHQITKKYVFEIFYDINTDTYTAYTLSFFARRKQLTFKAKDVVVPDIPGMFTSFVVKGHSVFVDLNLFKDPVHYSKLIGFDKPINLHVKPIKENVEDTKQCK